MKENKMQENLNKQEGNGIIADVIASPAEFVFELKGAAVCSCTHQDEVCGLCYKSKGWIMKDGKLQKAAVNLNTNYNEDCLKTMRRMKDNFIDLTVTSPPYNLGNKHHTGNNVFDAYDEYKDDMPEDEYQLKQREVLNELYRVTKEGGSLMYNHKNRIRDGKQITPYEWILKTNWTLKQELVWFNRSQNFDKCRFYPMTERIYWLAKGRHTNFFNEINQHDLIEDLPEGTDKEHKRAFPVKLAQRLILCFKDAQIIYDPYMGSGTTAIASLNEKRNWIGSEISKNYCQEAIKRIEKHNEQQKDAPKLF